MRGCLGAEDVSNHQTIVLIMIIPCLLALGMLLAMWGVTYTWAAANHKPASITLSEGIENLDGVKITFVVFVILLGLATIPIAWSVWTYTIEFETRVICKWERTLTHKCLCLCSFVYVFLCSPWKVVCLSLIPVYDLSVNHEAHYAVAFTAFALILLGNLMLLIRRILILHFLRFKQQLHTDGLLKPAFMQNDESYRDALKIIVGVNVIFYAFEIACAVIFGCTSDGRAECTLTVLVIADMIFQPFDFYFDKNSLSKHNIKETKVVPAQNTPVQGAEH
jgi:hypothetical protein